jgi:hypothetical protein
MKSRIFWALLAGASLFGVSAQAQSSGHPAPTTAAATTSTGPKAPSSQVEPVSDSARISNTQALRFETSWGSANIIRGAEGPVAGRVGWFRDFDVVKLVEGSPKAVAEARNFQSNNFRGSLVTAIGAATAAIGIVVSANSSNNAASPILIIGGAGAVGWGLQHINAGYAALSKSLWWYNRDVAH